MCSPDDFPLSSGKNQRPRSEVTARGPSFSQGLRERASFCVFIFTQIRLTVETPANVLQKWSHFKGVQKVLQALRGAEVCVCVC